MEPFRTARVRATGELQSFDCRLILKKLRYLAVPVNTTRMTSGRESNANEHRCSMEDLAPSYVFKVKKKRPNKSDERPGAMQLF